MKKDLYAKDLFEQKSGRWFREKEERSLPGRPSWDEFINLLDSHLEEDVNWRKQCEWETNFQNTLRKNLDVAFGYETSLFMPYEKLRERDGATKPSDEIVELFQQVARSLDKMFQRPLLTQPKT